MKTSRLVIALTLLLFVFSACESEEGEEKSTKSEAVEVPAVVSNAFSTRFASAEVINWEKEDDNFEVNFKMDGVASSAEIDASGNILVVESEVELTALPEAVTAYLSANYSGITPSGAEKAVETNGNTLFEVQLNTEAGAVELIFDGDGNFVEQKVGEADEDGEGDEGDEDGEDDDDDEKDSKKVEKSDDK